MPWFPEQAAEALAISAASSQSLRSGEIRYRGVVENQTEMICRFSPEHRITFMNSAMANYFGLETEQAIGERLWDLVTGTMYDCLTALASSPCNESNQSRETMYATPEGNERWLQWSVRPVEDPEAGPEFQAVGTDITTKKLTELALAQANRKLSLLCSITRHDITNQVTVCFGHLELLKRSIKDEAALHRVEVAAKSLGRIKNQIDFVSAYQNVGANRPQWLKAGECFRRAFDSIGNADLRLSVDLGRLEVFADPMLERVFYNLLDNSLRHGGHVTKIDVSCEIQDHWMLLYYADDGVGITREEKEQLFELGRGRNTGHGLFLTKEILGMTGMAIYETGTPGEGVRFKILIPPNCYRLPLSASKVD
jgi:PAS domain S-box-containing protein